LQREESAAKYNVSSEMLFTL